MEQHPVFIRPEDPKHPIWRYMDITTFMTMLVTKSLWLARADILGDPHEGAYGTYNQQHRPEVYKDVPEIVQKISEINKILPMHTYVSCWHLSTFESAAMWDLYASRSKGVAIHSSIDRLDASLDARHNTFAGSVTYIDTTKEWTPEGFTYYQYLHKRKSFEHEKEFRVVFQEYPTNGFYNEVGPLGITMPVDLNGLIDEIYVAPGQPDWIRETLEGVISTFGLKVPVLKSSLDADPLY